MMKLSPGVAQLVKAEGLVSLVTSSSFAPSETSPVFIWRRVEGWTHHPRVSKDVDEDIYKFFEPEPNHGQAPTTRTKAASHLNRTTPNHSAGKSSGHRTASYKVGQQASTLEKKAVSKDNKNFWSMLRDRMTVHEGSSVLDLKADNYFSCAVGRSCSEARYLLGSSADVVSLLKDPAYK
ncbi:hypothetical protein CQW23_04635 [Capsicum baccatum]|uniref:Uncharacterized protein n=1 Tax=Capsicum baccatum TaxID=33114 RepID=A0A2G2XFB8_CAPBA|nr:hypothetical protein CQW23_04635 [Capsicum baccatum]